jgi:hypothetical protein
MFVKAVEHAKAGPPEFVRINRAAELEDADELRVNPESPLTLSMSECDLPSTFIQLPAVI